METIAVPNNSDIETIVEKFYKEAKELAFALEPVLGKLDDKAPEAKRARDEANKAFCRLGITYQWFNNLPWVVDRMKASNTLIDSGND